MSARAASPYTQHRSNWREFWFWLRFLVSTFTHQSLFALSKTRLKEKQVLEIEGLENLPDLGSFVLAANHYKQGNSLDQLACCIQAISLARPELANELLIVVGQKEKTSSRGKLSRFTRYFSQSVLARWSRNVVRVTMDNGEKGAPSNLMKGLRAWRKRVNEQPCFVYPEGKVNSSFQDIRPGAGRWLKSFNIPVIPTAIWAEHGQWHVRFGETISWSEKAGLEDLQLGLAIADLLPAPMAPDWQLLLKRWRGIHSQHQITT
jgi:hypothetical protein